MIKMTNIKSRVIRKILKLKFKLDEQYPPEQAKVLYFAQIIEKIAYYSNCLDWKVCMIRIKGIFHGLVIGTKNYFSVIINHNPLEWISTLEPETPLKVRKIGTKRHFILQILRLVSLTDWELKIPVRSDKLDIVYMGMILANKRCSDFIVRKIPRDYFFRPEVLTQFLGKKKESNLKKILRRTKKF